MPEEDHDTSGLDFWCEPSVMAECPKCGRDVALFGMKMSLCDGCGWKGRVEGQGLIVIHRVNRVRED